MARPIGLSKERLEKEKRERQVSLIKQALEGGAITRKAIHEVTGVSRIDISIIFREEPEVYAMYTIRRRMLVDTAADNIQDIVDNPEHSQCYQASKYVLEHYKSDLDSILDPKVIDDFSADISMNQEGGSPVVISFGKKKE